MSKHRAFASSLKKHGWVPVVDNIGRQGAKFGKPLVGPQSQAVKREALQIVRTQLDSKVSGALLNGGQFNFFLTRGTFGAIRDLVFRFRVTCGSGAARVAPVPFWFTRVEAYNTTGNHLIQTWYPDQIFASMAAIYGSQTRAMFAAAGFRPENGGRGPAMASGEQRDFYLPLPGHFFKNLEVDGTLDLGADIQFTFYTAAAPIVTTISGAPVLNIDALSVMANSEIPSPDDIKDHAAQLTKSVPTAQFLSCQQVLGTAGVTLTAGQPANIELRSITADVAAFLVCILSSTSTQANEALRRYVPIEGAGASDGKLDVLTPNSASVFGSGEAVPAKYARRVLGAKWLAPEYYQSQAMYVVPFCSNLQRAIMTGEADGHWRFRNENYLLQVTPATAGTAEVQTVTNVGGVDAADGGNFRLGWSSTRCPGLVSWTASFAYNETTANIRAGFNALESVIQDGITCSAMSAQVSAGTSFTLTFTDISGSNRDLQGNLVLVDPITLNDGGTALGLDVTRTTQGVDGFTTGAYTMIAYALYWRDGYKAGQVISSENTDL